MSVAMKPCSPDGRGASTDLRDVVCGLEMSSDWRGAFGGG